jgi:hypothetical protein
MTDQLDAGVLERLTTHLEALRDLPVPTIGDYRTWVRGRALAALSDLRALREAARPEPQPVEGEAHRLAEAAMSAGALYYDNGDNPKRWRKLVRKYGDAILAAFRPSPTQGDEGTLREAFNVNDTVLVTLKESGAEIVRKRDAELDATIKARGGKGFTRAEPSTTEPTKYQLWELMQIFGPHISLGRETPFDTQMRFARPHSATRPTPPGRGDEAAEVLSNVLALAVLKWGNLDSQANKVEANARRAARVIQTAERYWFR